MQIDLSNLISKNDKIAVALSGGVDSVALLHFLKSKEKELAFSLCAINVEHGIRGKDSISDSDFCATLCKNLSIPLLSFKVDAVKTAKENSLSLEESARKLRYECFEKAINDGFCNKVATAHHKKDNLETVLFNLFRGTSLKGVSGIPSVQNGKIIRPFLSLTKSQIIEYANSFNLPFVTDKTNFDDKYARNFIRLNILPRISEIFPEAENSVYNFSRLAKEEDEYLDSLAKSAVKLENSKATINLEEHKVLLARAVILAVKHLGIEKDWEKVHVDEVLGLIDKENGKKITLPKGVLAIREYDKIVIYKKNELDKLLLPFDVCDFDYQGKSYSIKKLNSIPDNLNDGLYLDKDKIDSSAVIRTKEDGDKFTKFGGGTKSLSDFLTDKKIPLRERDSLPVIAVGNEILAIFNIAVSDKVKIDDLTKNAIKIN